MTSSVLSTSTRMNPRASLGLGPVLYALVLGASLGVQVKAGATLLGSDVIVLASLPVAVWRWSRTPWVVPRAGWLVLVLTGIWLLGAVASDLVNAVSPLNWMRGTAIIVVFASALFVMFVFVAGRGVRERSLAFGMLTGLAIEQLVDGTISDFGQAWKFVLGIPVAIALALLLDRVVRGRPRRLPLAALALISLGMFSLFEDDRSLAAFLLIGGLVTAYKWFCSASGRVAFPRLAPKRLSSILTVKVLVMGLGLVGLVFGLYLVAVSNGWLGPRGTRRVEQSQAVGLGPILNVLIGSRPQLLISSSAIAKHPLIGYGSWPQNCELVRKFEQRERALGITAPVGLGFIYKGIGVPCLIPTHSHLFGAWVWSGILGVPIWLYLWASVARWAATAIGDRRYLEVAPLIMAMTLIWAIPFSPFGGVERVSEGFFIAVILTRRAKRRRRI